MVYLIEKIADMYDSSLFSAMVFNYIKNGDKIKQLSHYIDKYVETPFDYEKRRDYLETDVVQRVKYELHKYVKKWVNKLRDCDDIIDVSVNPSSDY